MRLINSLTRQLIAVLPFFLLLRSSTARPAPLDDRAVYYGGQRSVACNFLKCTKFTDFNASTEALVLVIRATELFQSLQSMTPIAKARKEAALCTLQRIARAAIPQKALLLRRSMVVSRRIIIAQYTLSLVPHLRNTTKMIHIRISRNGGSKLASQEITRMRNLLGRSKELIRLRTLLPLVRKKVHQKDTHHRNQRPR